MDIDISRSKKLRTSTGNGTGTVHSGTCSSDGCTLPFCITVRSGSIGKNKDRSSRRRSLEKDKDLDYQYCLKHYVAEIDSDERLLNGDVIVEDEYGLASQMKGVNSLWKEAVADVVLSMYDLQKIEETKMSKDPLAILTMGGDKSERSAAQALGISVKGISSDTCSSSSAVALEKDKKDKRLNGINSNSSSSMSVQDSKNARKRKDQEQSELYKSNPYIRRQQNTNLFNNIPTAREVESRQKQASLEEEETAETDKSSLPCVRCKSHWTRIKDKDLGGVDGSGFEGVRGEVWGSKDTGSSAPTDLFIVECRKCGFQDKRDESKGGV